MTEHDKSEQAYKNGYAKGFEDGKKSVEVVHGRWEDEYGGKFENHKYRCSVCEKRALHKFERDLLGSWQIVPALTDYCHNCGAKLDLEV